MSRAWKWTSALVLLATAMFLGHRSAVTTGELSTAWGIAAFATAVQTIDATLRALGYRV